MLPSAGDQSVQPMNILGSVIVHIQTIGGGWNAGVEGGVLMNVTGVLTK